MDPTDFIQHGDNRRCLPSQVTLHLTLASIEAIDVAISNIIVSESHAADSASVCLDREIARSLMKTIAISLNDSDR
jgi:hypothetical protein